MSSNSLGSIYNTLTFHLSRQLVPWGKLLAENRATSLYCICIVHNIHTNIHTVYLSPLLFSLLLNDLPTILHSSLQTLPDSRSINFPSSCLLFADDLVLFSENPEDLQTLINSLNRYCTDNKLQVNSSKTKILVIGQNPKCVDNHWFINNENLEIVAKYKYLGIWFNWNCNFKDNMSCILTEANRSLYLLQTKIISLNITDFNVLHHLFSSLIKPIVLYGAEIWGLYDIASLESILMKYYKFALRVSPTSSNVAILSECGIHNIAYHCLHLAFKYYYRISSPEAPPLIQHALKLSITLGSLGLKSWHRRIKSEFIKLGHNIDLLTPSLKFILQTLLDQQTQFKMCTINKDEGLTPFGGSKLRMYRLIKSDFQEPETYLTSIRNPKLRQLFTKLRISDHNLMIEIGRRTRPITPVLERKCTLCSLNSIEDEVHFLIVCPFYFIQPRSLLFSFLNCRYSTFKFLSSHEKFIYVLGSRDPAIINQTSQYISKATQLRLAYLSPPI